MQETPSIFCSVLAKFCISAPPKYYEYYVVKQSQSLIIKLTAKNTVTTTIDYL